MTLVEAAKLLRSMNDNGPIDSGQPTRAHLFGIRYAREIENMSLPEITARAGISSSDETEIRKGMKLAKHVTMRP